MPFDQHRHFQLTQPPAFDGFTQLPLLCARGPSPGYYTRNCGGDVIPLTGDDLKRVKAERGPAPQVEIPAPTIRANPLKEKEGKPPKRRAMASDF